ncbi:MAG: plasmid replication, integration and excision activator [Actinomycetes bacterium]
MAIQRRIPMRHGDVFPHGAYLIDEFAPVGDYDAARRPDGSRPQATDQETGLPVWSVAVIDADPEAGKNNKSVNVKVSAKVQPVPPENKSGTPFTLVEFSGITATPWIDDSGPGDRGRLAWSIRATGVAAPGQGAKPEKAAA